MLQAMVAPPSSASPPRPWHSQLPTVAPCKSRNTAFIALGSRETSLPCSESTQFIVTRNWTIFPCWWCTCTLTKPKANPESCQSSFNCDKQPGWLIQDRCRYTYCTFRPLEDEIYSDGWSSTIAVDLHLWMYQWGDYSCQQQGDTHILWLSAPQADPWWGRSLCREEERHLSSSHLAPDEATWKKASEILEVSMLIWSVKCW